MPQDAFTIYHIAKELNSCLKGARIDKINQPGQDYIVLGLRTFNKNEKLIISANAESARVSITKSTHEAPLQAPAFCMLLRKHLSHATIESIDAIRCERIIKISFSTKNELRESGEKLLYVEIMGKYSNITLTENGYILGAIKQSASIDGLRPIFPGIKYQLPTPQDKTEIYDLPASIETMTAFKGGDISDFLFNNFKGISARTAIEISFRYFNSTSLSQTDANNLKIADFIQYFYNFYDTHNYLPNTVITPQLKDFFVTDYKSINLEKKVFKSISEAIDAYFSDKDKSKNFNLKKRRVTDAVNAYKKKIDKKYQIVLDKILSTDDMDTNRLYGELLIANLYRIQKGERFIFLENYYTENYDQVKILLDENLSAKENAEKYFKRYNKQKKTLSAVLPQKTELEEILVYIKSLYDEIELCETIEDFIEIEEELKLSGILKNIESKNKKHKEKSTYRSYNCSGFDVFVGRNNLQNDRLTLSADRNDVWLHTKDYHSAHVIIKSENRQVPDEVLLFAAELCAYFSKASKSDKVPVDVTLKKFVKKPPKAKPGTVFYTNQKTILVTPKSHQ